jgi:hypothetical protein
VPVTGRALRNLKDVMILTRRLWAYVDVTFVVPYLSICEAAQIVLAGRGGGRVDNRPVVVLRPFLQLQPSCGVVKL